MKKINLTSYCFDGMSESKNKKRQTGKSLVTKICKGLRNDNK